jgi:hypothetical protein
MLTRLVKPEIALRTVIDTLREQAIKTQSKSGKFRKRNRALHWRSR